MFEIERKKKLISVIIGKYLKCALSQFESKTINSQVVTTSETLYYINIIKITSIVHFQFLTDRHFSFGDGVMENISPMIFHSLKIKPMVLSQFGGPTLIYFSDEFDFEINSKTNAKQKFI